MSLLKLSIHDFPFKIGITRKTQRITGSFIYEFLKKGGRKKTERLSEGSAWRKVEIEMYIVLAIAAFMIVSFIIGKVPYGVTTMTCCVLLVLTGYCNIPTAFSGLANKTTILIAGMFTMAYAFGKTSLINKIRRQMERIKGKSGMALVVFLFGIAIVLSQLMGRAAVMSIMILFVQSLDDSDEVSGSRMIFAILSVVAIWSLNAPIGLGATKFATINALYEGIASNEAMMVKMTDPLKVAVFPGIILTIYALLAWKLIPSHPLNTENVKAVKETAALPKRDEIIITVTFLGVMVSFALGNQLGNIMNLMPAIGVLILIYTKCLTVKEAVDNMTKDMTWMIAGVLVMSDALGKSGVGELIGSGIIRILGENPKGWFVLLIFTVASIVMTTFMSNTGTMAVLIPIGASTALAGGMDPRGIVIAINIASILAIGFPSGSAEAALVYGAGRHNPFKLMKYTVPYLVLAVIGIVVSANYFFPVTG